MLVQLSSKARSKAVEVIKELIESLPFPAPLQRKSGRGIWRDTVCQSRKKFGFAELANWWKPKDLLSLFEERCIFVVFFNEMAKAIANDWQCEEIRCIAMNDTWRFNGQWRRRLMCWLVFGESQVFAVHVFCWCFGYASFPKQAVVATSMFVDAFWWEFSLPLHFAKQYLSLNCGSLYDYLDCNLIHKQCCRYFHGKTNQNYAKFCCDDIVGIVYSFLRFFRLGKIYWFPSQEV